MAKPKRHLELRGRMLSKCVTLDVISKKTQMCQETISHYLTGKYPWPYDTILDICELCEINPSEIPMYFERSAKS